MLIRCSKLHDTIRLGPIILPTLTCLTYCVPVCSVGRLGTCPMKASSAHIYASSLLLLYEVVRHFSVLPRTLPVAMDGQ